MNNKKDTNLTDRHLVNKVLGGDTNAFGIIIKNTQGLVAQITYKMINNAEDRKDIAQEVYLKAFRSLANFKFEAKLSTWIGQITYNTCLYHLEKKKLVLLDNLYGGNNSEEESLENINNKAVDIFTNDTQASIFQKQLSKILDSEIENLSPIYKTLIALYHSSEMSYDEIAQITQLPEGTVKNYLFRARKALKNNLLRKYNKEDL